MAMAMAMAKLMLMLLSFWRLWMLLRQIVAVPMEESSWSLDVDGFTCNVVHHSSCLGSHLSLYLNIKPFLHISLSNNIHSLSIKRTTSTPYPCLSFLFIYLHTQHSPKLPLLSQFGSQFEPILHQFRILAKILD